MPGMPRKMYVFQPRVKTAKRMEQKVIVTVAMFAQTNVERALIAYKILIVSVLSAT